MSDEEELEDMMHKDSFVRADQQKKKPPTPQNPSKPAQPSPPKEGLDGYIPDKVGNMVDNVFGKLDNLVNDAADYLFGGKAKGGIATPPQQDHYAKQYPPLPQQPPPSVSPPEKKQQEPRPEAKKPPPQPPPQEKKPSPPTISRFPQMATTRQAYIKPIMPEAKPHIQGPVITRTTSIADLELPLEILDDPDLARYFEQMKLYESQVVTGGLCNMSQYEATRVLQRGQWKNNFPIKFEDLKEIDPGIYPMEMARNHFLGMRPVYKVYANRFSSREKLLKAIEEDINSYLKNGTHSQHFHKFIYQVVPKRH